MPGFYRLVNGRCIALIFVLPPVSSAGGSPMDSDWFRRLYAYRDHDINLDDETAYLEAMQYDFEYRQASESRETQALAAVRSARAAADLGVGLTPGASTLHDASVALTGWNVVTGEKVGWGGRGIALIGMALPGVSGGMFRGTAKVAELIPTHGLRRNAAAMRELVADISANGIREPIRYVDVNGARYIVDGHHRTAAARRLGMDVAPVEQVELPYAGYTTALDLFDWTP